jgi:hypothetical protein
MISGALNRELGHHSAGVSKEGCASHRDRPFEDNSKGKFCLINWLLFGDIAI